MAGTSSTSNVFSRAFRRLIDDSLLLVAGASIALIWANADAVSYGAMAHALHTVVNDVGMVFFFALATKEVVEAMLPGGALASPRQAAMPILAAVGGMAAPAALYAAGASVFGHPELLRGWAVPCATDIAFSYLTARAIFARTSPAIPFLLLLAIADDALGLIVLALFYPSGPLALGQAALYMAPALVAAWTLRRQRVINPWAYLIVPGGLSWMALHTGGLHPALALVPIIPFMPSARRDLGLFDPREEHRRDTLNRFEHTWKVPVQVILFFFGLANAGVPIGSIGVPSWLVLGGLLLGKPIGILATTLLGEQFGLERPRGLDTRTLFVVGVTAGMGFTVALFFATAAFPAGARLDQVKMGALLSFLASPLAFALARWLRIPRNA